MAREKKQNKGHSRSKKKDFLDDVRDLEKVDGREGADTLRLWEGFREQAYLWRFLALIQVPVTGLAVLTALVVYTTADTIVEVPQMPQPGHYSVKQLPDSEFIDVATEIVNHMASYQPKTARRQFRYIRGYLWEPALTVFEEQVIKKELVAIEETGRSQLFLVDRAYTRVQRFPGESRIVVRLVGSRQKMIGTKILPEDCIAFFVEMTTIPRSAHNEFGIVATDIRLKVTTFKAIKEQDELDRYNRPQVVRTR